MKKLKVLKWLGATLLLMSLAHLLGQTNSFKISMMGADAHSNNANGIETAAKIPYTNPVTGVTIMVNSSWLNILANDGFNLVTSTYPDPWTSTNEILI